jgi:hypothetical protein
MEVTNNEIEIDGSSKQNFHLIVTSHHINVHSFSKKVN